jgi:hypothetical protein
LVYRDWNKIGSLLKENTEAATTISIFIRIQSWNGGVVLRDEPFCTPKAYFIRAAFLLFCPDIVSAF